MLQIVTFSLSLFSNFISYIFRFFISISFSSFASFLPLPFSSFIISLLIHLSSPFPLFLPSLFYSISISFPVLPSSPSPATSAAPSGHFVSGGRGRGGKHVWNTSFVALTELGKLRAESTDSVEGLVDFKGNLVAVCLFLTDSGADFDLRTVGEDSICLIG